MTRASFIADHIQHAISGPAWHGPSFNEALGDVTPDEANLRPFKDAHSIAELAAHIGVWARAIEARLHGKAGQPSEKTQWKALDTSSRDAWELAIQTVRNSHSSLAGVVRTLSDEQLDARAPGRKHSVETMLHGVIEHTAYHGGQISILKKAIRSA